MSYTTKNYTTDDGGCTATCEATVEAGPETEPTNNPEE